MLRAICPRRLSSNPFAAETVWDPNDPVPLHTNSFTDYIFMCFTILLQGLLSNTSNYLGLHHRTLRVCGLISKLQQTMVCNLAQYLKLLPAKMTAYHTISSSENPKQNKSSWALKPLGNFGVYGLETSVWTSGLTLPGESFTH